MNVAIIGHAADKFTPAARYSAKLLIMRLLRVPGVVLVSGRCPLGGVDVWAEQCAGLGLVRVPTLIYPPTTRSWATGYKPRNLQIARAADVVHVLVVRTLPPGYQGMRHRTCYHCARVGFAGVGQDHVKSGACWTARKAIAMGKPALWHIIDQWGAHPRIGVTSCQRENHTSTALASPDPTHTKARTA